MINFLTFNFYLYGTKIWNKKQYSILTYKAIYSIHDLLVFWETANFKKENQRQVQCPQKCGRTCSAFSTGYLAVPSKDAGKETRTLAFLPYHLPIYFLEEHVSTMDHGRINGYCFGPVDPEYFIF